MTLLSVCNQLASVGQLRKEMVLRGTAEREGALACIAGVIGVPIGLALLHALSTRVFGSGLGTVHSSFSFLSSTVCSFY